MKNLHVFKNLHTSRDLKLYWYHSIPCKKGG